MKRLFRFIIIFILLTTLSLSAKILHVYESGGAQAIQDSITSASLSDTVMVHNGKYYIGDLADTLGLRLHLKQLMSVSPDSASSCTLTALSSNGLDTAIHVIRNTDTLHSYPPPNYHPTIQGFTIRGQAHGYDNVFYSGGIQVLVCMSDSSALRFNVRNNRIIDNDGGIYIWLDYCYYDFLDTLCIEDNVIQENQGFGILIAGGGIDLALIRNNLIIGNQPGIGGVHFSRLKIEGNVIKGNSGSEPQGYGGGIYLDCWVGNSDKEKNKRFYTPSIIEGNLIKNNTAYDGGAIYISRFLSAELNNNIIYRNKATYTGAIYCSSSPSDSSETITGYSNVIVGNIGSDNIFLARDSIRLHNNFILDNCGPIIGINKMTQSNITNSNIYYNTYQLGDRELRNYYHPADLRDNFWWYTDSVKIASLIRGSATFMPFNNWFEPEAPGEPEAIYSVMNYDSGYSTVVDYLGDPDTLYLEIMGHDRHPEYREAAVAILKSNIYRSGIAVGLLETDKGTGVYRGEAYVRHTSEPDSIRDDDIHQIIRVNAGYDTIKVIANIDNSKQFRIYYRCQGGVKEEDTDELTIRPLRNTTTNPSFKFFLPEEGNVNLSIYDVSGRKMEETVSSRMNKGWHRIESDIYKPGVYLYRLKFEGKVSVGKVVVIK